MTMGGSNVESVISIICCLSVREREERERERERSQRENSVFSLVGSKRHFIGSGRERGVAR